MTVKEFLELHPQVALALPRIYWKVQEEIGVDPSGLRVVQSEDPSTGKSRFQLWVCLPTWAYSPEAVEKLQKVAAQMPVEARGLVVLPTGAMVP
jgi:hypothetical protein